MVETILSTSFSNQDLQWALLKNSMMPSLILCLFRDHPRVVGMLARRDVSPVAMSQTSTIVAEWAQCSQTIQLMGYGGYCCPLK